MGLNLAAIWGVLKMLPATGRGCWLREIDRNLDKTKTIEIEYE